jgi:hypothetical protein
MTSILKTQGGSGGCGFNWFADWAAIGERFAVKLRLTVRNKLCSRESAGTDSDQVKVCARGRAASTHLRLGRINGCAAGTWCNKCGSVQV